MSEEICIVVLLLFARVWEFVMYIDRNIIIVLASTTDHPTVVNPLDGFIRASAPAPQQPLI
jgi:hypothetical protein